MLAGLERATYGRIMIGERTVNTLPPKARDVAMVFQSYALYPHKTVHGNLAFGMKVRREPKAEIRRQVHDVAALLGIDRLLDKRPAQLSGGERQRVALGRALLRAPQVFLMDEPLSNLDAALRAQMRAELIRLHARLNATMVYVTHDQAEAMTMATRIAVMAGGHLCQVDTPAAHLRPPGRHFRCHLHRLAEDECRHRPADGRARRGGRRGARTPPAARPANGPAARTWRTAARCWSGIRPEDVLHRSGDDRAAGVAGAVEVVEPLGSEAFVTVRCGAEALVARFPPRSGDRDRRARSHLGSTPGACTCSTRRPAAA